MAAIQKIYDRTMAVNEMTTKEVLKLRSVASKLTKRDQG